MPLGRVRERHSPGDRGHRVRSLVPTTHTESWVGVGCGGSLQGWAQSPGRLSRFPRDPGHRPARLGLATDRRADLADGIERLGRRLGSTRREMKSITAWRSFESKSDQRWIWAQVAPMASSDDAITAVAAAPSTGLANLRHRGEVVESGEVESPVIFGTSAVCAHASTVESGDMSMRSNIVAASVGPVVLVVVFTARVDDPSWGDRDQVLGGFKPPASLALRPCRRAKAPQAGVRWQSSSAVVRATPSGAGSPRARWRQ